MGYLTTFRASSLYRKILRKKGKLFVTSSKQDPANIRERAESMIDYVVKGGGVDSLMKMMSGSRVYLESRKQLADAVIALLVDAGIDRDLVEVEGQDDSVMVYLKPSVQKKLGAVKGLIGQVGQAEIVERPDDNPQLGVYVIKVTDKGSDLKSTLDKFSDDNENKEEGKTEPQDDVFDKRGRRVMLDDTEVFTPTLKKHRKTKKPKPTQESILNEDDFGLYDNVFYVADNAIATGTIVDITGFGTPAETYYVRMLDGSIKAISRDGVFASPKAAASYTNKFRGPHNKISVDVS